MVFGLGWPGCNSAVRWPSDAGLLLVPCNSVHTCFVRFPVDVVFLDGDGSRPGRPPESSAVAAGVGTAQRAMRCWRCSRARQTCSPARSLRLEPVDEEQSTPPKSVAFLQK